MLSVISGAEGRWEGCVKPVVVVGGRWWTSSVVDLVGRPLPRPPLLFSSPLLRHAAHDTRIYIYTAA